MPIVRANNIEIYDEEQGSGDGKPIIFVHGYGSSHECWNYQVQVLSDRYRCGRVPRRPSAELIEASNTNKEL